MQIRRLFVEDYSDVIHLSTEEHHYASRVLRLQPGHVVELVTPTGCMPGRIESMDQETIITSLAHPEMKNEPELKITLLQGMPDHVDKLEVVVQKAVELGASAIIPFLSRYTDAKYRKMDVSRKLERMRKIAREAVRQCRRTVIPKVSDPINFMELKPLVQEVEAPFLFFEHPIGDKMLVPPSPASVGIIIGPEGGFADHEVEQLMEWGSYPVNLPGRTLRTETAGLVALTLVMARFGDYRNLP